jgi:hypothetical protein
MSDEWYDGLPDEAMLSEVDRMYMKALSTVREGLAKGLDFDRASAAVEIKDEAFRQSVLDDVLKVMIAEEHFVKQVPLEDLAKRLGITPERIKMAHAEMMEDVEKTAVKSFYDNIEKGTEH